MNKGGTIDLDGIKFTMTHALHSGGFIADGDRITYLGDPAGFVIEFENGTTVYAAGDTALFGDMELIGRYLRDRRPLPAVSLATDPSVVSCIANDFGYDDVFARQVEALANPGDVVGILSSCRR